MEFLTTITDWVKARFAERSTWDGGVIVAVSVAAFLASPLIKYIAVAGALYGAWRMYEADKTE